MDTHRTATVEKLKIVYIKLVTIEQPKTATNHQSM